MSSELNELKKVLYKKNPTAYLQYIQNGVATYVAYYKEAKSVYFDVPISDMGETAFKPEIPAKHLIRWIARFDIMDFYIPNKKQSK